jgi:hypothetical protein
MPISELPPGYDAWRTASPPDDDDAEWAERYADYSVSITITAVLRNLSQDKESLQHEIDTIRDNLEAGLPEILGVFDNVELDVVDIAVEGTV